MADITADGKYPGLLGPDHRQHHRTDHDRAERRHGCFSRP
jgi:hypothetical protein